jgi:hypothetical protein
MSTPTASVPDMNSTSAASIIAIDAIAKRPLLIILLLHSVLGAMCVPLLLTVLYFSTAHLRRAPVFLLVIFQIIVGISYATWMSATMVRPSSAVYPCRRDGLTALLDAHASISFGRRFAIDLCGNGCFATGDQLGH